MHFTKLIIGSLVLNLALAGAAIWLAQSHRAATPAQASAPTHVTKLLRTKRQVVEVRVAATNTSPPAFHWRAVESEDYRTYVANLRAIGCPEATLREIIKADLEDLYLRRRKAILEPIQIRYWDLAVHSFDDSTKRYQEDLDQLEEQTKHALQELLGPEKEKDSPKQKPGAVVAISHLSEAKQQQFAELQEKFDRLRQAIPRDPKGTLTAEARERQRQIQQEHDAAIRELLTSDEYDEYKLRTSRYAGIGNNLVGFDATEDELRAIVRIHLNSEHADEGPDPKQPDFSTKSAEREAAKHEREQQLRNLLGDTRWAEFTRAQNGNFQQIYRVAERYGLPVETAAQVDDLRKAAVAEAQRVHTDKNLSAEVRQAALQVIQRETESALRQRFGEGPTKTYRKHGGAWIGELTRP